MQEYIKQLKHAQPVDFRVSFKLPEPVEGNIKGKIYMMLLLNSLLLITALSINPIHGAEPAGVVTPDAKIEKCADGFKFSEGPVSDSEGNIYFSDYGNDRIHIWSVDGTLSVFKEKMGGPIGLYFDKGGYLWVCAAREHRIKRVSPDGDVLDFPNTFNGKLFNSPNDIWVDAKGGVYFTDPRFSPLEEEVEQDGFHIFYIKPDTDTIIRAAHDLTKPNGIVGSPDGALVYVTETPVDKTYVYTVNADGTLSDKRLFAPEGYDGLAVDSAGNVYITMEESIEVYNPSGKKIESIKVPGKPTNVCFGGKDKKTLFITARSSLFSIRMRIQGW
ncbi:MAG: SMP-30/gluconolactonase/LRE family protein [Candidatus Latescibacteria bacterium]|nr:SMP-30/gluconolactonase/LRE family protein [Candidatus Latescibacterota bacterium]